MKLNSEWKNQKCQYLKFKSTALQIKKLDSQDRFFS